MHRELEEDLLNAWIGMSLNIRGNRLLTNLSFNEIVICGFLYRSMQENCPVTATDLSRHTKLLKSQLNKVLTMLEQKGLVERIRSQEDKRKIFLRLREDMVDVYLDEHAKVMKIVHHIFLSMGEERARALTELLSETVDIVDTYVNDLRGSNQNEC